MNGENEPSNDYKTSQFDGYNHQKSRSYPSEYKEYPMPYQFEYNIDDGYGNKQDRHETADSNGNVVGSYGYVDSNGIYRKVVDYTAGPEGFVAKINSNEPYLKHKANPAHVMLNVEDPPPIKTNINYAIHRTNSYAEEDIKHNDKYDHLFNNQIRDQIYRASDNRQEPHVYVDDKENDYDKLKPILTMFRPQQQYTRSQTNANPNQHIYQSINPIESHYNRNADDIQAYASDRRYYD
ncbi:unnamed protein product [Medioppia subpectinata]|uniref:Cuticular protein n=1 Tax=Medioppia subpectinata TaxID=1979941 RepID=A0A7R9PVU4_9ACAR|nr:unnamed protein product [Medioppia subpectinata]CAG2103067.1 unnamed protein product [Medioppia subpectinata]